MLLENHEIQLIPYTAALISATLIGREELERKLGLRVAADWPGVEFLYYLPFVLRELQEELPEQDWTYLVVYRQERMVVGEVSVQGRPWETGVAEIGYSIVEGYQKRGLTTMAVQLLLAWLKQQPQVKQITAKALAQNSASRKVMEKLGFVEIGEEEHGESETIVCYEYQ